MQQHVLLALTALVIVWYGASGQLMTGDFGTWGTRWGWQYKQGRSVKLTTCLTNVFGCCCIALFARGGLLLGASLYHSQK